MTMTLRLLVISALIADCAWMHVQLPQFHQIDDQYSINFLLFPEVGQ